MTKLLHIIDSSSISVGNSIPPDGIWMRTGQAGSNEPNEGTGSGRVPDETRKPDRVNPVQTGSKDICVNMFHGEPIEAIFVNSPNVI